MFFKLLKMFLHFHKFFFSVTFKYCDNLIIYMAKPTIEEVLKKKVEPLVDKAMHRFLGVTISELRKDITEKNTSSMVYKPSCAY